MIPLARLHLARLLVRISSAAIRTASRLLPAV